MSATDKADFIRDIIAEDNRTGKYGGRVHTRFPPEPNGYLHIGHAKSINLNYGVAREHAGGVCNLRFVDTNPEKEEQEYVDSIVADVKWIAGEIGERIYFASDYFGQMYQWAVDLVMKGKAYVPPNELVVVGLYGFVRNPMYVAGILALAGWALWSPSLPLILAPLLFFVAAHTFVTLYEEPTLRVKFGVAYEEYLRRVPRWIPRIRN